MELSSVSRIEGTSVILPLFEEQPWFEIVVTEVKNIEEVFISVPRENMELTLLEDVIFYSMLDRLSMVIRGTPVDYRLPKYQRVFKGVISYHVYIRKTIHYVYTPMTECTFLESMSDRNMRPNKSTPSLKLTEIESFYDVNEETVILPYQRDFLFRQSNSRNPHLKLLYLFNCLDSERTVQIENTIKEFFKDNKSANVYFLPMGIVISDVFKSLLLTY